MDIQNFLHELGGQIGLGTVGLNENRAARLVFDERVVVDFEASEDLKTTQIYSVLGRVPAEGKGALFSELLEANLFGYATGGGALSIDPATSDIVLYRTLETERYQYQDLVNILEQFVGAAEMWSSHIAKGAGGAETAERETTPHAQWDGHFSGGFLRA